MGARSRQHEDNFPFDAGRLLVLAWKSDMGRSFFRAQLEMLTSSRLKQAAAAVNKMRRIALKDIVPETDDAVPRNTENRVFIGM